MSRGAVVVVNYGSADLLAQNLTPLRDERLRVVVVDNLSTEAERTAVRTLARQHGWDLLLAANDGFGTGMNAGVEHAIAAGCDAVLLVNPDLRLDVATALALLDHARRHDAVVCPAVRAPDGRETAEGRLDVRHGRTVPVRTAGPDAARWLTGACLALRADRWRDLGGFVESYVMYWEDIDFTLRYARHGVDLVVRSDLLADHDVGGTQGGRKSPLYLYYNCRNRLLFARLHLPWRARLTWLLHTPRYAYDVVLRAGSRRLLLRRPRTAVWPAVRGSVAGAALVLGLRTPDGPRPYL